MAIFWDLLVGEKYDALPILPTWIRYSAAGIAMIGAGSVETLFLQRWTHKLVNVVDKTVLQKTENLNPLQTLWVRYV